MLAHLQRTRAAPTFGSGPRVPCPTGRFHKGAPGAHGLPAARLQVDEGDLAAAIDDSTEDPR